MRTKTVYVFEREDVEILRKARDIMHSLYNAAEIEFEDDKVEFDVLSAFGDIEEMCIDECDLNELDDEIDYDDEDDDADGDDEDDEEDEPVAWCEYCGSPIYEDEYEWIAADGSVCCCDECVVEYNREMFPEDDEEDED